MVALLTKGMKCRVTYFGCELLQVREFNSQCGLYYCLFLWDSLSCIGSTEKAHSIQGRNICPFENRRSMSTPKKNASTTIVTCMKTPLKSKDITNDNTDKKDRKNIEASLGKPCQLTAGRIPTIENLINSSPSVPDNLFIGFAHNIEDTMLRNKLLVCQISLPGTQASLQTALKPILVPD